MTINQLDRSNNAPTAHLLTDRCGAGADDIYTIGASRLCFLKRLSAPPSPTAVMAMNELGITGSFVYAPVGES